MRLDLNETRITDAGLPYLSRIPSLKCVMVNDTEVTAAGAVELGKSLPAVKVYGGAGAAYKLLGP